VLLRAAVVAAVADWAPGNRAVRSSLC
jgi:hypothetical protein